MKPSTESILNTPIRTIDPERIARRALNFVNVWSPPGEEGAMAEIVALALTEAGVDDVRLDEEFAGSPSVIARVDGPEKGPVLQWHGHLDAIRTPHPPGEIAGGRLSGRGVVDMKGALAAMVEAVRVLKEAGLPRHGSLLITFHGLHEEGGNRPLLRLIERGIVGDAVMIGELASGDELVVSSRGLTFWTLRVVTGAQPVHEANANGATRDALSVTSELVNRLHAHGSALRRTHSDTSLFVGHVSVGDYFNRVPSEGVVRGNMRHGPGRTLADIEAELRAIAAAVADELQVDIQADIASLGEAYELSDDVPVAAALQDGYRHVTRGTMRPVESRATGNAVHFVTRANVPAVYYGLDYASAHSDFESIDISDLGHLAAVFTAASASYWDIAGNDQ